MSAALKERLFNARARSSDSRLSTASPQTRKGQEGSTKATQHCNHSPWLLRRTSVQVSSESSEPHCIGDSVKTAHTQTCVDQDKRGLRTRLAKLSGNPGSGNSDTGHTALQFEVYQGHEAGNFGTTVTIQAVQPSQDKCRDRHEMKGLEQAASVKRWPGGGKPSEAWGKLMKVSNKDSIDLSQLITSGPGTMGCYWRHTSILWIPATTTFVSPSIIRLDGIWIGGADLGVARRAAEKQ